MKNQMSTLLAGVAACAIAAPALAQQENQVRNEQRTWAEARAELNGHVRNVTEGVSMTAAAIGNSFSAELGGSANVRNFQDSWRNATANMYVDISDTAGSLEATTAAIGNSASISIDAFEGDGGASQVSNTQFTHWGRFYSDMMIEGGNIIAPSAGDVAVSATAASIANSLSVNVRGDLAVGGADENIGDLNSCDPANEGACEGELGNLDQIEAVGGFEDWSANSRQFFRGDSRSTLNADLNDVVGAVELTSAALGNSASFDIEGADTVQINTWQFAGYDPQAFSNVEIDALEGDFTSTTAAISNSLSVSTLPATAALGVNSTQFNRAYTGATANIHLHDVTGSVSLTAAAIGNSASISNLPDGF